MFRRRNRSSVVASARPQVRKHRQPRAAAALSSALEMLESRRLFTLLGVNPEIPSSIFFNSTGIVTYTYDAGTDTGSFNITNSTPEFFFPDSNPFNLKDIYGASPDPFPHLEMHFNTDGNGNFKSNAAGPDLIITGAIDMDSSGAIEPGEPSGILLTAEVTNFGSRDTSPNPVGTDDFDFRLIPTGGLLAPLYDGKDIGIVLTSENSTFNGDFHLAFGGHAKGTLGPIPGDHQTPPGKITGTKFIDITGNSFSADDTPAQGVTVNLYADADHNSVLMTTMTDVNGQYTFDGLDPGVYFVQEVVPAGYTQTGGAAGYTVTVAAGTTYGDNNFDNFENISIKGTKYTDKTGNGITGDDIGLGGITINLYQSDGTTLITSTTTANDGSYSFNNLGPATYVVKEVLPSGYEQTVGNGGYIVTPTSGVDSTGNDFANFEKINISGTKYNDVNGNGVVENGDLGLSGITINLYQADGTTLITSTQTANDGSYSFNDLPHGTYVVKEVLPSGSVQTLGAGGYVIVASSGADATGNNFANFKKINISGKKYADKTGNGITGDDTGLGGITIRLYQADGTTLITSTTTNPDGTYSFNDLGPGTYVVKEVLPNGSTQTVGNNGYTITATSGNNAGGNNFANFVNITISGTKFKDLTGNSFSGDDTPLAGVTINLYNDADHSTVIASTVTGADGTYSFPNLGPGSYFVQEVVPTGYKQTGGNAGYTIVANSGTNASGKNFDNAVLKPGIDIEKTTNGLTNSNPVAPDYDNEDAANGPGVPVLTPGSTVTWTYKVTNTGELPYTFNQVVVTDDNGTTGTTADDLSTTNGRITFLSVQTGDADNILEPGEVWLYTASDTVQTLAGSGSGTSATFDFSGSSNLDGPDGNIRSYTANGIKVNVSAFGRSNSSGTWSTAWLGSYGGGLGVTDGSDGSGGNNEHTVDNSGSDNYVLFEFDQNVIVDSAFLGYVVGDSDLSIWIGTVSGAFNSHQTLSDAFLAGLGFTEVNDTSSSSTRTADFNGGGVSGNVLIIAAKTTDSNDKFKIENLTVCTPVVGVYENKAVVSVPGDSDSDLSHYKNNKVSGKISGTKYLDLTGDGFSSDDTGLGGVTIKLFLDKNNNNVVDSGDGAAVATTTTASNGSYSFNGLGAGKYLVQEVVPTGYVRTGPTNTDTYVVTLAAGQTVTGKDFDNFDADCDLSDFCNVYYIINNCKKVYDLRGNTDQGDTVTVVFTYKGDHAHEVSLVSYKAPASSFDAGTAYLQQVYESKTILVYPGKTYSITVHNPDCYYQVDFVCGDVINQFGPAGSNIFYTPQGRLISADNGGTHACFCGDSSIAGFVFGDCDNDGDLDPNENGIKGVLVTLTGKNDLGQDVLATAYTDSDGFYEFDGLRDGTYKVVETQPSGYADGKDDLGSLGGTLGNDVFSNIVIAGGNKDGEDYNFGEACKTTTNTSLCGGMTATIGYWQNKNGQSLIKKMNGSSSSTKLGYWLGTNFPNLFGGLKYKTNSEVAAYFCSVFKVKGAKIQAQILATALAVYVTDKDLAGGTYASSYGFTVNSNGTGSATFNVGSYGWALGLTNNKSYSIMQILTAANNANADNGSSWVQTAVNNLFDAINNKGDI